MTVKSCVVRGARVRVLDSGPSRGAAAPVLVALHGYPDTGRIYAPLAEALTTMRLIAPDWPGQGESDPVPSTLGPTERAAWLAELLDVLEIERCAVFGHDMGALPALAFARDHRARVRHVTVANALLSNDARTSLAIRAMRTSQAYRIAIPYLGRLVFERCIATFLEGRLGADVEDELRRAFLRKTSLATVVCTCSAYDDELPLALRTMTSLDAPVLALWGSHAAHFSIDHARALKRFVPTTKILEIRGAHWMAYERCADIATLLQTRGLDEDQRPRG